ncbi:fructose-bisphosphate aldolase-lysine N-methyltransferase, chloroplastic isoform X2 [Benincasa hispida]|uniref:fructose-bisphosphate aldolase-lysine N-methyltransferase, chloroplastic isoform X2 n=1 Tax=Benincasa hispida TaxID=102211 RepID=UPI0018FF8346|nr:fructose-bisphosphate aldolase-lysine N-methyltransferase, chloroplastic isoform X2 [Benincasa hispida]
MLLGIRFNKISRWRTSPVISASHAFHFNGYFSTTSPLEELRFLAESNEDTFLPWLERKAEMKISSVLSIGKSSIGRFLFASETIRAGDCILKQISPDVLPLPIKNLLGNEIGNVAKLAVVVLLEQKLGSGSEWAPYITRLPQPWEMHNTMFWNESELEMIRNSSLYEESLNQRSQIEREFLAIRKALETFPEIIDRINCDDFMHAHALVTSRAWRSTEGVSLIPFADFLNHNGASEAMVLNDYDKQLSEVIADRDYAPGEQVLIRYGKYSNATLMLDFGFALPYNIHDQVQVQVKTDKDDPLARIKLEIWLRSCTPGTEYVRGVYSTGNSFTIREVRCATGKGRGLPQSLRAFARILSCSNPQGLYLPLYWLSFLYWHDSDILLVLVYCTELNELSTEAVNGDGRLARIPLKNVNKEVEAHQILLSQFKQLVEEYNASIEALEPVDSPCLCKKLAWRRLMAHHLLTGELRILKSAIAWLEKYCDAI